MALLDRLADSLLAQAPADRHSTAYILPSRRACLVFKDKLKSRSTGGFLAPLVLSIEEFFRGLSGRDQLPRIEALGLLYEATLKVQGKKTDPIAFLGWGPVFLNDLDELEHRGADLSKSLRYLEDYRTLEKWGIQEEEGRSEHIANYLAFWSILPALADAFLERCATKSVGLGGSLVRLAEARGVRGAQAWMQLNRLKHIEFVGLNALTAIEERLVKQLCNEGLARFSIDIHPRLLEAEQEAGVFLRSYLEWGVDRRSANEADSTPWNWTSWGVSGSGAQLQLAAKILLDWVQQEGPSVLGRCALVLADESLLPAALSALPEELGAYNVTMGLRLTDQPLFGVLEKLLEAIDREKQGHRRSQREKTELCSLFAAYPEESARKSTDRATRAQSAEALIDRILSSDRPLFEIATWANQHAEQTHDRFTAQTARLCAQCLEELERQSLESDFEPKLSLWFRLLAGEVKLNFVGEPLEGLQIMGLLESRALGFEKLIVVSTNEGLLPKSQPPNSLLPPDLRKELGLNGVFENDAVYAHHFFQLLSEAGEAHLLWNALGDQSGAGEPSRFLLQLEHEWTKAYPQQLRFQKKNAEAGLPFDIGVLPEIVKTPSVLDALRQWLEKGISPSALTLYLTDPIEFYYRYLVGIKQDEIPGQIDAMVFGRLVHLQFEKHFTPYLGKAYGAEDVKAMKANIDAVFLESAAELHIEVEKAEGSNYLALAMSRKQLREWLEIESRVRAEEGPMVVDRLEEKYKAVELADGLRLTGVIDRVEHLASRPDLPLILDFKTGVISNSELSLSSPHEAFMPKKSKAFQLMCYAAIIAKTQGYSTVKACISSTVKPRAYRQWLTIGENSEITAAQLEEFTGELAKIAADLLDPEKPFKAEIDYSEESDAME